MVAITPDSACLNTAGESLHLVYIARPDTGAQAVECVIGDFHRFVFVFECGHTQDRTEYLLLENPHLVMAFEYGRFDVKSVRVNLVFEGLTTDQNFGTFLLSDIDVIENLLILITIPIDRVTANPLIGPVPN